MVGVLKDWMDSNSRNGVDYKFSVLIVAVLILISLIITLKKLFSNRSLKNFQLVKCPDNKGNLTSEN